jgi:hypothetical protein
VISRSRKGAGFGFPMGITPQRMLEHALPHPPDRLTIDF